jgi:Raf kinase inhibitor-like YbhB/YbcL family protein
MRHVPFFLPGVTLLALVSAVAAPPVPSHPNPDNAANDRVAGHLFKPKELPPPALSTLKVPAGFKIERFAENLGNARILAIGPDGSVYVTRREEADVLMIKVGPDGRAAGMPVRVAGRAGLHGIAFHGQQVYLATPHEIFRAEVKPDGTFGPLEMIIHNLPDAGQHHTRMVQVGPDEKLYIGVGSTTNAANEPNPESATLLRAALDGKSRSVFASGLRDLVGWGWHPETGELWGVDHGIDWLGDDAQPEELNRIEKGRRYGWPFFYADNQENEQLVPPGGLKKEELKRASTPMVLGYTAHSSPMQMSFYTANQFPAEYRGDAFVSMRGSWNRKPPAGYEIVRIRFERGQPTRFEPFVTGFISRDGESGRPCGNAIAADGSLLFTDDRNGIIYRVSHESGGAGAATAARWQAPAGPMREQNREGVKEPLAGELPAMGNAARLQVRSSAYAEDAPIPVVHSAYDQNASIPLAWEGAPTGTRSFAILMEDPDASLTPLPVVHWVVWNVPADTTALREGLPPAERLRDPNGLRQGVNAMGFVGYFGPRPPEGDPAHRYALQVFALDRVLDLPPGTTRRELLAACEGHVLAVGTLHGKFARPERPKKP